ncbi:S9 family peptidase [Chitinophagaceae bacterium MMS25-I14]
MRYLMLLLAVALCGNVIAQNGKKSITLEDIWKNNTFRIKSVPGFNAMNDGKRYTQIDNDGGTRKINVYDLQNGKKQNTLFDAAQNKYNGTAITVDEYVFSKDEKKMLLLTESQNIYRRSVLHKVYVFDIRSGQVQLLDNEKVLHASFSPDGSKVAFVKNNNLYYRDLNTGQTVTITTDGERNKIINGNCDWVYEEEFEFTQAYEWNGNGSAIAYYRFDESQVPQYTMTVYDSLYPTPYQYKYPKAGEPNSVVEIKIYDLKKQQSTKADIGTETDQYIPRIKWTNENDKLCIYRMNRLQNKLELLLAEAGTGSSSLIYVENNASYIEINDNIEFLPDNTSFIFESEQSGYNHLYRWDWKTSKLTSLTDGLYDIETLIGVDNQKKLVYYTAAEASPMERKLYSVDWNGENKKCITNEPGTHSITACRGNKYFLDKYSALNAPPVYSLIDASGKKVRTLEDNKDLKATMQDYALGNIKLIHVTGDSGTQLNAWMITPPGFDSTRKYPVLMFQYSGPGSQQVADKFPVSDFFWHQMLAEKGYIVICADGTGTGFRGEAFRKKTYLQLGKYESNDQIAAARYLGTLPYVDKSRIGIWGWSFGGFMSSTCIMKGNDVFKMAIAVAPVTNWRFYDNIYTERYMRRPQENQAGYDENAPEKMVGGLKGKFLLIHGTGDDNVHFQNSVMMVDAMIKNNKDYDSEYYPNKAHGISGGNTRLHLYRRMTEFILQNL